MCDKERTKIALHVANLLAAAGSQHRRLDPREVEHRTRARVVADYTASAPMGTTGGSDRHHLDR